MKETIKLLHLARGSVINGANELALADINKAIDQLEELSILNLMKIDEERFKSIYNSLPSLGFEASFAQDTVKEYNSTLEDHQVLQPLPDEMPNWFRHKLSTYSNERVESIWNELIKHYGTPTKKELVSVDELEKEFLSIVRSLPLVGGAFHISLLAQHIIDTYSLNPTKREWWMDLKEGEKFKDGKGGVFIFDGMFYIGSDGVYSHPANKSTPYIEPTIFDKFMASLSDEQKKMYEEMKETTK